MEVAAVHEHVSRVATAELGQSTVVVHHHRVRRYVDLIDKAQLTLFSNGRDDSVGPFLDQGDSDICRGQLLHFIAGDKCLHRDVVDHVLLARAHQEERQSRQHGAEEVQSALYNCNHCPLGH